MKSIAALVAVLVTAVLLIAPGTARPAFPGTNGKIAFASDRDGDLEIYVMNSDGTGATRLTNSAGDDVYPVWSATGSKIAFTSAREGNTKIFSMSASGASQTRISNTGGNDFEPAWSPSGTQLAFVSDSQLGLEIWTINADGTNPTRLTGTVDYNVDPVWSPNGNTIAFTSSRDGNEEIYTMNTDGTNPTRLTSDAGADAGPAFSPDGSKIAFQSTRDGDREIYVMNSDGTNQTRLTNNPAFDSSPAWSPDGSKILFQSNRDGDFEIFVMNTDGSGQTQLTNNTALDRVADWQPLGVGGNDTTDPVLTLPANLAVNATSPAGAVATYAVSATDDVDPSPIVACLPQSGSTFAVGTTTVSCTATDASGNASNGSFTVTVLGAKDQIGSLLHELFGAGLPPAVSNLLANFDPNNPRQHQIACAGLRAFAVVVQAQSGRRIPAAQAAQWIADANRIRAVLGC